MSGRLISTRVPGCSLNSRGASLALDHVLEKGRDMALPRLVIEGFHGFDLEKKRRPREASGAKVSEGDVVVTEAARGGIGLFEADITWANDDVIVAPGWFEVVEFG